MVLLPPPPIPAKLFKLKYLAVSSTGIRTYGIRSLDRCLGKKLLEANPKFTENLPVTNVRITTVGAYTVVAGEVGR